MKEIRGTHGEVVQVSLYTVGRGYYNVLLTVNGVAVLLTDRARTELCEALAADSLPSLSSYSDDK